MGDASFRRIGPLLLSEKALADQSKSWRIELDFI